jgi:hypothetical protein
MEKLTQMATDGLKLILRSPDVGDGWRDVAPPLRKNMPIWLKSAEGLYEFDGKRIRLTPDGLVVARYL